MPLGSTSQQRSRRRPFMGSDRAQFRKHYVLNEPSTLTPVVKNIYSQPPYQNLLLLSGKTKVYCMSKTFTKRTYLMILQSLQPGLNYLTDFFCFLQARHFVQTTYPHFPNHPLTLDPAQKRSISVIYNSIDSLNPTLTKQFVCSRPGSRR